MYLDNFDVLGEIKPVQSDSYWGCFDFTSLLKSKQIPKSDLVLLSEVGIVLWYQSLQVILTGDLEGYLAEALEPWH